jgi:hypothetical protein
MNQDQFWEIIARACLSDLHKTDEWADRLEAELKRLAADEIILPAAETGRIAT